MKPKIIFFGTPNFAVGVLDEIKQRHYIIDAVVSSPDRKSGRGRKIKYSAVKDYCLNNNIKLYQPESLKEKSFILTLKEHQSDLFVVVAFRMIPKVVWSIPKLGTFNLHASLLPKYRGAAPINWVIINQEKVTGLTTFLIDEKIDTGKILLKSEYQINKNETFDSLHDNLLQIGKILIIDTIQSLYQGKSSPIKQDNYSQKIAPKLTRENTRINWNNSLSQIISFINGLNSYPGAWSQIIENEIINTFKIFESDSEYTDHNHKNNQLLVVDKQIKISHKQGFLIIKNLQLSNKKRLSSQELLNGHRFNMNVFVQ